MGSDPVVRALDDRAPYASARAVIRTIARLSDEWTTEEAVEEAIVAGQGPGSQLYLATIARSSHSIFYHQLQELYEFGRAHVRPEASETFCLECGRAFMDVLFGENLLLVLRMGLARPGSFQSTVGETLKTQLYHYAGEKYVFSPEAVEGEIVITLAYRQPEVFRAYLAPFGLDPDRCFRNSFEFIGGAFEEFTRRIIEDYEASRFRLELDGDMSGRMHLPIGEDDRFAYERMVPTLIGYIADVKARQEKFRAAEELESGLIIESDLMRETWHRIRRASRSDELVLLRGESGTGKSFIARRIHDHSPRRDKPFVEVGLTADIGSDNLIQSDLFGHERGAFTGATEQKQGLFQLADGGTIFLDEIGDASAELQAKLLRVLETHTFKRLGGVRDVQVDVRVIAATNRDLERMIEDGEFRRDLYYRLNVIPVQLPPLRERREEIPALAEFLLARTQGRGKGPPKVLAPGLADQLRAYDWPGNIRELDHALKHAAAMAEGGLITADDLPASVKLGTAPPASAAASGPRAEVIDVELLRSLIRNTPPARAGGESPAHVEYAKRTWLTALIDECGGDLALIARYWDRSSEKTLRNLVRSYGLADRLAEARKKR